MINNLRTQQMYSNASYSLQNMRPMGPVQSDDVINQAQSLFEADEQKYGVGSEQANADWNNLEQDRGYNSAQISIVRELAAHDAVYVGHRK